MLAIKHFQPEDILALDVREPDKWIVSALDDPLAMAREYVKRGPSWTLWNDTSPVACAGIVVLWNGVGEAWALTSPLVSVFPVAFHRAAKQVIAHAMFACKLHRLQVSIPISHGVSCQWVTRLGFILEGPMPKYGPDGADYLRFSRFV